MKLILTNFLCYTHKEFDLSNTGITLIHGPSGAGKTTIFRAILFCLFKIGNKLYPHGLEATKKLEVKLEYDRMIITRQKRPERLLLEINGITYEGDDAQVRINKFFGSSFGVSSCILQKKAKSFFNMTNTEKMKFLEDILFDGIDVEEMQNKLKDEISIVQDKYKQLNTSIITYKEILESSKIEKPKFEFDKTTYSKSEDFVVSIKELLEEIKKLEIEYSLLIKEEKKLELKLVDIVNSKKLFEEYSLIVSNLENELSELQTKIEKASLIDIIDNSLQSLLQDHRNLLEEAKIFDEVTTLKKVFSELQENYVSLKSREDTEYTERQKFLKEELSKRSKSELLEMKKLDKEYLDCNSKLDMLESKLEKVIYTEPYELNTSKIKECEEKIRSVRLYSQIKYCPSCRVAIRINGSNIEECKDTVKCTESLAELESTLKILVEQNKKDKNTLQEIIENNKLRKEYEKEYKSYQVKLNAVTDKLDSMDDIDYEKELKLIEEYEKEIGIPIKYTSELRNLEKKIKESKIKINTYVYTSDPFSVKEVETALSSLNYLVPEYKKLKDKIDIFAKKLVPPEDVTEYEKKLEDTKEKLLSIQEKIVRKEEYQDIIARYDDYKRKKEAYKKYKKYLDILEDTEEEYKKTLDYYTGLETFKKKIKEAESIALATLIDDLNEKFQYYVDMFFEEEKAIVSFATFKENKKGDKSVNINLQIFYKGTDTELSALSGGEEDRIEIAFVLALSDIIQSPLLLLDEAISSLDSETCDNVLRKLESTDKCILLIAHQVTKGIFNNTIGL